MYMMVIVNLCLRILLEPSAPPNDITIDEITSETLALHWSKPPCRTRHGEIVRYEFALTNGTFTINSGETVSQELTFENLIPFTTYNFRIAAVTSAGRGNWSDSLPKSTNGAGT